MNPKSTIISPSDDLFVENLLEDKLQRIKEQINQSHSPSIIKENDEAIMINQFKKYQIDLANIKKQELQNNVEECDKKLKDISKIGMKINEEDNMIVSNIAYVNSKIKNNMQVIQNKPNKTNCRLLNEEIENELEANAQDFVKKLRRDKQKRNQNERNRLEKNVYMYIKRQERSCDAVKNKGIGSVDIGVGIRSIVGINNNGNASNLPRQQQQFNQQYGLKYNNSNSKLTNTSNNNSHNHNRMKSPSLGIFYAPIVNSNKKKELIKETYSIISPHDYNYPYPYPASHNKNSNGNISNNQGYSIHYINHHDLINKSYLELNNQKRSPYYFNEPKYASIIKNNYEKIHLDKTDVSLV